MTMVCSSYILIAPEGLHIAPEKRIIGYVIAGLVTIGCMFGFIVWAKRSKVESRKTATLKEESRK